MSFVVAFCGMGGASHEDGSIVGSPPVSPDAITVTGEMTVAGRSVRILLLRDREGMRARRTPLAGVLADSSQPTAEET